MIFAPGAKKFVLNSDKLCFGHYQHLRMLRSNGHEGSNEPSGTADILFVGSKVLFLWVPVK